MDINRGRSQGFVSKVSLNGQKIRTIFIKVGSEGMSEGVAGNASGPSKPVFMFMDVAGKKKGIDGSFRIKLFWEKPAFWSAIPEPVISKDV